MRLPRDMSGEDLAGQLRRRYGYQLVRQRGSHMTLTRTSGGESADEPVRLTWADVADERAQLKT